MVRRNSKSGGVFLTLAILVGLAAGIAINSPILGVLGGTIAGIVIVIAIWVADRRG